MGLIRGLTNWLIGDGRNVVAETVEVFRENSEAGAQRISDERLAALSQFATEFGGGQRSGFDRAVDALNRLPRPMLALGTIGLIVSAMVSPDWFAARMMGVALIPEPLWWLMGAIVSFYFGARYQVKGQEFQKSVAESVLIGRQITAEPKPEPDVANPYPDNAALADWWRLRHAV